MIRHSSAAAIALALSANVLTAQSATPEWLVKTVSAAVHQFPTVASTVIGKAPGGTVLEVRRHLGSWVEVPWPNAEGGVAYVHVSTGLIAPRPTGEASAGETSTSGQVAAAEIAAVATKVSSAAAASTAPSPSTRPPSSARRATHVSLPSHRVGIGPMLNTSKRMLGATARTWLPGRFGAQFNTARPQIQSVDGQSIPSTEFAPSGLYSLPEIVTNSVWLRPYAGAGPRFHHANLETRIGYEAFGGAEITLSAMPQFALSADLGRRFSRPSFDGFEPRRMSLAVSGHWYVK